MAEEVQTAEVAQPVKRKVGRPKGSLGKNNKLYHQHDVERFVNGMQSREKNGISAEDNKRYTARTMEIANLPIINMCEPNQVRERVQTYFDICQKYDLKPNMAGLALALHTDRMDILRYCNGQKKCPQETIDILMQCRRMLNDLIESYQYDNKGNPVSLIFLSKNNFGYKDQTDVVVNTTDQFGDVADVGTIRNKYLDNMVDDSVDAEQK